MIARTIARPSPVDPDARERELSPRAKRSNRTARVSSGMPGPSSSTVTTAKSPGSTPSDIATLVEAGVCIRALASRFTITCCRRTASPGTTTGSSGASSDHSLPGPAACASLTASMSSRDRSTGRRSRSRPASSLASSSRSSTSEVILMASDSIRASECTTSSGSVWLPRLVSSA